MEKYLEEFAVKEPLIARISHQETQPQPTYVCTQDGYALREKSSINEANLICAGQIIYDAPQAEVADFTDFHLFRSSFKPAKEILDEADLAIASFSGLAADCYPATETLDSKYNQNPNFRNARSEYLDAIHYGGFNCLAMSGPYCAGAGVRGVLSTSENIKHRDLIPSGIGTCKDPIIDVNNIRIAVLSYTLVCYDAETYFTESGKNQLLNLYDPNRAKEDLSRLKNQQADFILVYLNCETEEGNAPYKQRLELATELAELGADYVICNVPGELSKFTRIKTSDGRLVPAATSLGTFLCGTPKQAGMSAILHLKLYKQENGCVDVDDHYLRINHYHEKDGNVFACVPSEKTDKIAPIIGNEISPYTRTNFSIKKNLVPQLTIGEIYDILGAKPKLADRFRLNMNQKVTVVGHKADLHKGCAAVRMDFTGDYTKGKTQFEEPHAVKAGAVLYIGRKPGNLLPSIVVPNAKVAYRKLMAAIREKYNPITVAVTGTAGKTTTKELMCCVFDTHYKTLHVDGNFNQFVAAGMILQKLTPEHEAYVQEVHGGTKDSAKNISNMIRPNIALITNIGQGHLADMGSMENVIKGKMDIIAGLQKDGVLIIDDDNEYLHEQHPNCRVIRYSLHNESCDYYAKNIQDLGDKLRFQIVCKEGTYDAQLNFQGIHNVSNALGVFAAGREAGIPPYKILAGLTHYVPHADKQNLIETGGYKLLIDSYSSTAVSVESSLKGLASYPIKEGERRIAVFGDIPALGDHSEAVHKEVAAKLVQYDFDMMLCCGQDSIHFVEAAKKAGKEAYFFDDRQAFNQKIIDSIRPGDLILFKGGTRTHFKEETIYPLFGKLV